MPNRKARADCYAAIRAVMRDGIQGYYKEHPERMLDERSTLALEASVKGLKAIFAVLDQYEISVKKPETA